MWSGMTGFGVSAAVTGLLRHRLRSGHTLRRFHSAVITRTAQHPSPLPTNKEFVGPLAAHLIDQIKITGPISVAQFMRAALTHPLGGYYMKGDVFGARGDFTTSPEISQMFGEIIAVWLVNYWQTMPLPTTTTTTKPKPDSTQASQGFTPLRLIELGPGRGTLMKDIINTLRQLKLIGIHSTHSLITDIHLVEASQKLRQIQKTILTSRDHPSDVDTVADTVTKNVDEHGIPFITTVDGLRVYWHDALDTVPTGVASCILAHEFFDAMPIYKFEKTEQGWREILVDIDTDASSPHHFRFVRAPQPTKASIGILPQIAHRLHETVTDIGNTDTTTAAATEKVEKEDEGSDTERQKQSPSFKPGDRIEISPEVSTLSTQIAQRVHNDGGVALIIDYGRNHILADSLRGIRYHAIVNPLTMPGECDLSVDVDFSAIADAVERYGGVAVHGPVPQGLFLTRMGIGARAMALMSAVTTAAMGDSVAVSGGSRVPSSSSPSSPENRRASDARAEIVAAYERLVDPLAMGSAYKVMAITPAAGDGQETQTPYAFEPEEYVDQQPSEAA